MNVNQIHLVTMNVYHFSTGWQSLSYPFRSDDAGRSQSRRPRQTNDCTVRALAKAAALDYDAAYDLLKAAGRKAGQGFDFKSWAKGIHLNGLSLRWYPLQAVKGQLRETLAGFAANHRQGVYILRISKHVLALIDGVVYDTFESRPDKCVYGYWTVNYER